MALFFLKSLPAIRWQCLRKKHTLPDLPYDFGALEPYISAEIMRLHHQKHHATYVNNLNIAEEKHKEALAKKDTTAAIALQPALRFNGGGHINHSIFWKNLAPKSGGMPIGKLAQRLPTISGSGWAWLGYDANMKRLQIATCANQDPLQATTGLIPLLGIDVWEHAYYLQYKNVRGDYVKAIWEVINWNDVQQRYADAVGSGN
ncbi:Superoxide dismutase [Trichinella pseudospiralis]